MEVINGHNKKILIMKLEGTKQQKVGKLIHRELSDIFQKDPKGMFGKTFITITEVKVSPDLSLAKIYVSFMLVADKEAMIDKINGKKKEIRRILGNKIAKKVRIVPELAFYLNDSAEYAAKMDKIISELEIPPPENEEEE